MTGGDLGQFILYASIVAGAIGALSEVMGEAQRAAGATERLLELMAVNPNPVARHAAAPARARRQRRRADAGRCGVLLSVAPGHRGAGPRRWTSAPAKRWPWSARPAPARPRCSSCSCASTIRKAAASARWRRHPQLDLHTLRDAIGIVPQDTVIFSADAMENIRYGRAGASDEEVIAAAKMAAAHEFIERLPKATNPSSASAACACPAASASASPSPAPC
jgi:ATP-binding cassette subfamily B protein